MSIIEKPQLNGQRKKRRLSNVFLYWDSALEPSVELKKLRKNRLGVHQTQFDHIQYQLYTIGCLSVKDGRTYTYPSSVSTGFHIEDTTYIKICKHLCIPDLYKFLIWKYANCNHALPNDALEQLFNSTDIKEIIIKEEETEDESYKEEDLDRLYDTMEVKITKEIEERKVQKNTTIKINDVYTLQNVTWTIFQRKAARNTRNFYLYNFDAKYPMLEDIEMTDKNRSFVSQLLISFMKAKISARIISNICCSCFGLSNVTVGIDEKTLTKESLISKEKIDTPKQRSSITNFSYMEKENKAACIIQRFVRVGLQRKKNAVAIIEKWWLPFAIEAKVLREVDIRRFSASMETFNKNYDYLKYDEFKEEITHDFKLINVQKSKGYSYWLKNYFFVVLGCSIEYVLKIPDALRHEILIFALWILFQFLTLKRLNKTVIIIQTVMLIALTCRFLNIVMQVDTVASRLLAYFVIVNVSRQYWLYGLIIALIIRVALSFTDFEYFLMRPNEGFVFVYDIYSVLTIVACQRVGDPIEMLHKWMVGVIVFAVIAAGVAAANIAVLLGTEL